MLRTSVVFVVGLLLDVVVLGSLLLAMAALPWSMRIYGYNVAETLTGTAIGLFVSFVQKHRAGFVASICLLPPTDWQYVNRFSPPATGRRLALLLLGTVVEPTTAFVVAHRLSQPRRTAAVGRAWLKNSSRRELLRKSVQKGAAEC